MLTWALPRERECPVVVKINGQPAVEIAVDGTITVRRSAVAGRKVYIDQSAPPSAHRDAGEVS